MLVLFIYLSLFVLTWHKHFIQKWGRMSLYHFFDFCFQRSCFSMVYCYNVPFIKQFSKLWWFATLHDCSSCFMDVVYFVIENLLWNIDIKEQYPNCDWIKAFIILISLLTSIKVAMRASELSLNCKSLHTV